MEFNDVYFRGWTLGDFEKMNCNVQYIKFVFFLNHPFCHAIFIKMRQVNTFHYSVKITKYNFYQTNPVLNVHFFIIYGNYHF